MGILESAVPVTVICTRNLASATAFYRDTLGLPLATQDRFGSLFAIAGVTVRVSEVADFVAHEHTILGFQVPDVAATVRALAAKGVKFNRYPKFHQDDLGILTFPSGEGHVAWFADPDGNLLSVTDV